MYNRQYDQQYDYDGGQFLEQFEDISVNDTFNACSINVSDIFHACSISVNDIFHASINVNSTNVASRESDWLVTFKVNGKDFVTEIDTAAQCNIISLQAIRCLGLEGSIGVSRAMINGAHDEVKKAYG